MCEGMSGTISCFLGILVVRFRRPRRLTVCCRRWKWASSGIVDPCYIFHKVYTPILCWPCLVWEMDSLVALLISMGQSAQSHLTGMASSKTDMRHTCESGNYANGWDLYLRCISNGVGGIVQSTMRQITHVNAPSAVISMQDERSTPRKYFLATRSKEPFASSIHVSFILLPIFPFWPL